MCFKQKLQIFILSKKSAYNEQSLNSFCCIRWAQYAKTLRTVDLRTWGVSLHLCGSLISSYIILGAEFYYPVGIMKNLLQLLLHFLWHRISWRGTCFFCYSPSWRSMIALLVNIGEREKQKPLQRSHCNKAIATKPLQSASIFLICNSSFFVSNQNSNSFFLIIFLIYPSNKYKNNCFFDLYREILPEV